MPRPRPRSHSNCASLWRFVLLTSAALGGVSCAAAQPQTEVPGSEETSDSAQTVPDPKRHDHGTSADPSKLAGLESEATRARAIETLLSEYRAAAAHGSKTETALQFIESYAAPLAKAYVEGHDALDPKLRLALLTQLTSYADARTLPAHIFALQVYAKTAQHVDEAIWACQAAQRLEDPALAEALFEVFERIDLPNRDGRRLSVHLERAMRHNVRGSWQERLLERLESPIERPASFNDDPAVKEYQNQVYWQTTASTLIGLIGHERAAEALARVLLDNSKSDVHAAAELALVRIGPGAAEVAQRLLLARDERLVALARAARPQSKVAHVLFATRWLGMLGHAPTQATLLEAWQTQPDPRGRVLIVRALSALPKSAASLDAFKATFVATASSVTLPEGEGALETLAESSSHFFEPALVPWLSERAAKVPGAGTRKADVQRALVVALSKLALPEHLDAGKRVADQYGGKVGAAAFEATAPLARKCRSDAACYAASVAELEEGTGNDSAALEKAILMLSVFGKAEHRTALVERLKRIRQPRVRAALLRALDHLTPKADPKLEAALEPLIAEQVANSASDPAALAAAHELQVFTARIAKR